MATQKDVQDLLRLLTTGRNKLPMMAAMGRVKSLQAANLRSVSQIAESDLPTLTSAISDEKAAKALISACKTSLKPGSSAKRSASESLSSSSKKQKSAYELSNEPQTPAELEASLALPEYVKDEERLKEAVIYTNRAPLVLAFAVALLRYTMPEQPLSSKLSLGQAIVSLNSRSKAASLGLEKGKGAEEEGWGRGQPKVRVMGREVSVLKRSGYEWRENAEENKEEAGEENSQATITTQSSVEGGKIGSAGTGGWTISEKVTLKKSTFVARSFAVSSPSEARSTLQKLLAGNQELRDASHNITAWRVRGDHGVIEDSNDDGESGGGRHILGLLQADDIVNTLLVVTRWYGGIMLGPDRWRIMSQVSRDALSQRLRVAGLLGQEALWGLDLEAMRSADAPVTGGTSAGMPTYKPESARAYILKAFGSPPDATSKKKKSGAALDREREENLGVLLGALDLLFSSWADHLSREELDRRAWSWYVQVRPDVQSGVAGWGGKGEIRLADILNLRRKG